MAVYAIGDLQGCFDPLRQLLTKLAFNPKQDQLIFAGDLVNRGTQSLETLRFVSNLPLPSNSVLGNHDLHLLAMVHAPTAKHTISPDLWRVINAPDGEALLDWLRQRPLVLFREDLDALIVHAGVHPRWTLETTLALAEEVEAIIRGPKAGQFFLNMYGDKPAIWSDHLTGWDRIRSIVNVLTRVRFMNANQALLFDFNGAPDDAPDGQIPWLDFPLTFPPQIRVIFGHWSTLGLYQSSPIFGIDTGCLWGRELTALRLDSPDPTSPITVNIKCPQVRVPRPS